MMTQSAKALFRAKLSRPTAQGCIEWTGCVGRDGYGHVKWDGRVSSAHRVAFFLAHGVWPQGHVLHSCDNQRCCNPEHLRSGTHLENMQDCAAKGRNRSPRPGNGRAKLTPHQIDQIRSRFLAGEVNKSALAREFGVTPPRIRQLVNK